MIQGNRTKDTASTQATRNRDYAASLARAFGGALIFSLPLLMTMEMWSLGFTIDRIRLALFFLLGVVLIVGLSRFGGFERTASMFEDVLDAFAAIAVAALASALILAIFGVIDSGMGLGEIAGKIALQTVPAGFGAMIARKQLSSGGGDDEQEDAEDDGADLRRSGYGAELFLMLCGALFLALNIAPTEEMIVIGYKMSPTQGLTLVLLSIVLLHVFVYALGFSGQKQRAEGHGFWSTFFGYSVPGYAIAVLVALYALWTFGRTNDIGPGEVALATAVLAFPAAIGAAIARLVV